MSILEQTLAEHKSFLMNSAVKLMGNKEDAKDLYQETAIKIITRPERFDGVNFKAWAYRVMYRKFLDHLRKPHTRQVFEDVVDDQIHTMPDNDLTDELIIALSQLSEGNRRALMLMALHDYNPKEIARLMNISTSMVHKHLFRAKGKMRMILNEARS